MEQMSFGRFRHRMLVTVMLGGTLAGCAGTNFGAAPPDATSQREVADQARLRLTDKCMFELSSAARPQDRTAPRCQCYARGMLRQMSPAEVSAAASGMMPISGKSTEIMAACAAHANAYADAPPRPRARKPTESIPVSEPSPSPPSTPVPAPPPPTEPDTPKIP